MSTFALGSLIAWLAVVTAAALWRSRSYAIFRGVQLGLHTLIASALVPRLDGALFVVAVILHATVFLQSLSLVRPRMRSLVYRALISIPASFFAAGTLLAFPWAIAAALGVEPWLWWLPYAAAAIGVAQSLTAREEEVAVVVRDGQVVSDLRRHPKGAAGAGRALRIVQITDPHLGPFMSARRLRDITQKAVTRNPDLIVLTGDFLTMESQSDPSHLSYALEPLRALRGRTFACFGNHDHEAPETVRRALDSAGVRLLVDDATEVDTPAGPVQIVGMDFHWRERREHMARVCAAHPRVPGALRLVLLHDPGAFRHLADGEADLVLSGHTHGGQVGLVSLGLSATLLRLLMNAPDHGFWALGQNRLYVHRGTGHYGFPLRLGVPAESSVLSVHLP